MDAATLADGPSYWQAGVALVAVLGLLIVVLKGLQRWQGAGGQGDDVRLLAVRRLGPRRELQTLQVGERVHLIYRHDSAMILLETTRRADPAAAEPAPTATRLPLGRRLLAMAAAAGGTVRKPGL